MPSVLAVLTATAAGLLTGLGLIVAIGAQNAYVLRQGLARRYVGPVVAVCIGADALLIVAGVAGIGTLVASAPWLIDTVRWLGVAFLGWYGGAALLRARRPATLEAARTGAVTRQGAVLRACALTFLNPHVYLDTVLLLGSVANQHGSPDRWWFAVGAVTASVSWFAGLGFGAGAGAHLLATARAWQLVDALIGVMMLALALMLARG
jgi:L-lysine exporter family protein LysE/ArgO